MKDTNSEEVGPFCFVFIISIWSPLFEAENTRALCAEVS